MVKRKIKFKISIWQIITAILYAGAVVWNIRAGGLYNIEIAFAGLILIIIKIWEDSLR